MELKDRISREVLVIYNSESNEYAFVKRDDVDLQFIHDTSELEIFNIDLKESLACESEAIH